MDKYQEFSMTEEQRMIHKTKVLLSNHWTAEEIAAELHQPIDRVLYWMDCIKIEITGSLV